MCSHISIFFQVLQLGRCLCHRKGDPAASLSIPATASNVVENDDDGNEMEVELEDSDERANVVAELEDEIDKLYMTGYDDEELEGLNCVVLGMGRRLVRQ